MPEAPASQEVVEITDWMQAQCAQAYLTAASSLRPGISETAIAEAIRAQLAQSGIQDFWYDVPIHVLIGIDRFVQLAASDYAVKSPSEHVTLREHMPFFIDIHPRHESGRWGNFAATGLFRPQDDEAVGFLELMQSIQREGIRRLTPDQTGAEVARWFAGRFARHQIEHLDVRANFGHSMGAGLKSKYARLFLDESNDLPIGGGIYGIEPGGLRRNAAGQVIARFEDCVYIPPDGRPAVILGRQQPVPLVFV